MGQGAAFTLSDATGAAAGLSGYARTSVTAVKA